MSNGRTQEFIKNLESFQGNLEPFQKFVSVIQERVIDNEFFPGVQMTRNGDMEIKISMYNASCTIRLSATKLKNSFYPTVVVSAKDRAGSTEYLIAYILDKLGNVLNRPGDPSASFNISGLDFVEKFMIDISNAILGFKSNEYEHLFDQENK